MTTSSVTETTAGMNWTEIGFMIAAVGLVVSFFQWHVNQNYKRLQDQIRQAIGRQEHIEQALEALEKRMQGTRDELHTHYPRKDHLDGLNKELKREIENVFGKLSGLSRSLAEVIGELRADRRYRISGAPGSGDGKNVL